MKNHIYVTNGELGIREIAEEDSFFSIVLFKIKLAWLTLKSHVARG